MASDEDEGRAVADRKTDELRNLSYGELVRFMDSVLGEEVGYPIIAPTGEFVGE